MENKNAHANRDKDKEIEEENRYIKNNKEFVLNYIYKSIKEDVKNLYEDFNQLIVDLIDALPKDLWEDFDLRKNFTNEQREQAKQGQLETRPFFGDSKNSFHVILNNIFIKHQNVRLTTKKALDIINSIKI